MNAPRKLACPHCGSAPPAGALPGATVNCAHCGTTFRVPDDARNGGGISIATSGGSVTIHGDVVGGDKIVTGIGGAELIELFKQFQNIHRQIDERPADPKVDRDQLKDAVQHIREEVAKGEHADPDTVARWLTFLAGMADDIFQVTAATLANPAAGVAKAIQLIARKAKEEAERKGR